MSGACLCLIASACVDDNYDLSDVDTTVKVPVNNLTVPVNIEPVKLKNLFNLDNEEDDIIKEINGVYAVSKTGNFDSDEIIVNSIEFTSPKIESSANTINIPSFPASSVPAEVKAEIRSESNNFTFSSDNVSSYIRGLREIGVNMTLNMNLSFRELQQKISGFTLQNIDLQLPKGLENVTVTNCPSATYNATTGELHINSYPATGANTTISINADGINIESIANTGDYSFIPATDGDNGYVEVEGQFYILRGDAIIKTGNATSLPSNAILDVSYLLTGDDAQHPNLMTVTKFSGKIKYDIKDIDFDPIEFTGLPDVLAQESTNLELANPQIYLTINNPLNKYDLSAQTGMRIIAKRDGKPDVSFTLNGTDNDKLLKLKAKESTDGTFTFCLSPERPDHMLQGYENAKWEQFADLGKLLSSDEGGMPDELEIELVDPIAPEQEVDNFILGVNIGKAAGTYDVMAPLDLTGNSKIVYTDDVDGWYAEDLDHCTIERINIDLTISTDIPVNAILSGYPIDLEGNKINGVEIEGATIPANASNHKLTIHTTGTIPEGSKLNGIRFVATATSGQDNESLRPDMEIILDNLRPSITGYYLKNLDD
jgi:hypothetical protein